MPNRLATNSQIGMATRGKSRDFWLMSLFLLATVIIPTIIRFKSSDAPENSPILQIVWSVSYVAATFGVFSLRSVALPLVAKSISLWSFVSLMLLSIIWSVEPSVTLLNSIELLGTTIVALYIVVRFSLREMLELVGITLSVTAVLSLGLIFGAPGHGKMDYGSGAWAGLYQDKNNLGAAMSLGAISLTALAADARGRTRWLAIAATLLALVLLVGSNSITALTNCVAGVAVLFVSLSCRSARFGRTAQIVTAIAVVAVFVAVSVFGLSEASIISALGRDANLTGRTDFWPYIQQAIGDRPILGFGYNAFFRSAVGADYLSTYIVEAGGWTPYHSHNSYLQILIDAGIVGFFILIVMIATIAIRGIRYIMSNPQRCAPWPLAIMTFLLIGSSTETYLGNYNTFEWIFFVAALLYPLREITLPEVIRSAPTNENAPTIRKSRELVAKRERRDSTVRIGANQPDHSGELRNSGLTLHERCKTS
jgi:exopolysaccharide production protein ExoQ